MEAMTSSASLARTIYERLRADIVGGRWPPGHKLLMHELRAHYEVGATPLREALNRLVSEHWVVHRDQRGFLVAPATAAQLEDLVQTRAALESLALGQAFARRTAQWEEDVVLAFHRLSRTPRSISEASFVENEEWERRHRTFHRALLQGCNSPTLLSFCEQLYDQTYRYRQLAAHKAHRQRHVEDEHRALVEAVLGNRLAEAQHLLGLHFQTTAKFFPSGPVPASGALPAEHAAGPVALAGTGSQPPL
jgi:DNA-binding GntR family transcriptional regulator